MPIFLENRALLERFRNGEEAALRAVFDRYVHRVEALARHGFVFERGARAAAGGQSAGSVVHVHGVDIESQRELVQETFRRAFEERARAAYDGVSRYQPYLLRIARNLMIDGFRRGSVRGCELTSDDPDYERLISTQGEALDGRELVDTLHWNDLRARTIRFLDQLDDKSRTFVALRYEQGLSEARTADALACSRRRVRKLDRDIQARLRRFLERSPACIAPPVGAPLLARSDRGG